MIENEGATPVEDEITAVDQPKSMDDTIRETLRSLKDRGAEIESPADPEEKAERIRNDQGKFAKAKDPAEAVEAAPEAEPVIKAAPNTWKKGPAEKFVALDPEVQEEILRREADIHKGLDGYRAKAQFADAMLEAIEPFARTVKSLGVTPDVAVRELMAADHRMRYGTQADKQQYFAYLAQSYGVDLGQLPQTQQAPVDPTVAALQQKVEQLYGHINQQQVQSKQQADQALNSEISAFAADPKNRHFESVRGYMAALVQAGHARDLPDAYEQAIYANPATRAAVLAEQQAAARAEAAKKAQAARAASSVNVRSRPSMPVSQPIGSMDDTIRATLRRLQSA